MSKRALKQQQKERANLARSVRLANADFSTSPTITKRTSTTGTSTTRTSTTRTSTTRTSTTRASTTRASTTRASKAVDLVSSDKSETNSLVSSDYNTQEDDYFQDDDDDNGVNLVIKQLLAASAASFKKRSHPAVYVGNSKRTKQRKNKTLREAAVGSLSILQFFSSTSYENEQCKDDNEDDNEYNNEDDNESMTEKEKKIANAKPQRLFIPLF